GDTGGGNFTRPLPALHSRSLGRRRTPVVWALRSSPQNPQGVGMISDGPKTAGVQGKLAVLAAPIPRTSDVLGSGTGFPSGQMATVHEPELPLVLAEALPGVSFRVCVSDPEAADDLVAFFAWASCPAAHLFEGEVAVVLEDAAETPTELEFALAA